MCDNPRNKHNEVEYFHVRLLHSHQIDSAVTKINYIKNNLINSNIILFMFLPLKRYQDDHEQQLSEEEYHHPCLWH